MSERQRYQAGVRSHIRQRARKAEAKVADRVPTFGFYHPFQHVEALYWTWRSSDWQNLPDPGGTLDQDRWLMEDLLTYHQLYARAEDEVKGRAQPVDDGAPLQRLPSNPPKVK